MNLRFSANSHKVSRIHEPVNLSPNSAATRLGSQGCPPDSASSKYLGGPSSRMGAMREYDIRRYLQGPTISFISLSTFYFL